jgi:pimeloyl-ACP methyl ester carboxylesterase
MTRMTRMTPRHPLLIVVVLLIALCLALLPGWTFARQDSEPIDSLDHHVAHVSTAPGAAGQQVTLYMRERMRHDLTQGSPSLAGKVVLFLHGAALGGTGAFDAPYQDYSWMAYLAQSGFDAFSLDFTGFGFSTRPAPMNDPCNLDRGDQTLLDASILPDTCPPTYTSQVTTLRSDWDDLDTAVDYLRALRHVDRVSLVGWSYAGSRAGGYATLHPDKVDRLVLLSPSYDRDEPDASVPQAPAAGAPMFLQPREGVASLWDPQVHCSDQVDPSVRDAVWNEGVVADAVSWAPGLRRVPSFPNWDWNRAIAAKVRAPTLVAEGEFDQMTPHTTPEAIRAAYADLGTRSKVFVNLACSSHFAMWETRHLVLFQSSLEWLRDGSVNGLTEGEVRLGD